MKIKNLVVFLTMLGSFCVFSGIQAQSTGPKREVGLQFSSLDLDGSSFSAFFKKEKKENVYRRIRFATGDLGLGIQEEFTNFNFQVAFAIGREKRKELDDKLVFYHGPEFSALFSAYANSEDDLAFNIRPRFGWVFGLQHSFNERWGINIETIPTVYVGATINDINEGLFFGAGGSTTVSLGIVRKF